MALATSMQAAPGVYAVLLGSGISSAAGIMTGYQIVEDLIRRVARAQSVDLATIGLTPEDWWVREIHVPPSYSSLLEHLCPTQAIRQAVLRSYFEPSPDMPGRRIPTSAHRALAELCSRGYVRVVLTTNFDRLIEQALTEVGIEPQVIDRPSTAPAMTPLCHSPVTIVKLHGDYLSTELRNTAEELASYPPEWLQLLQRVFDEYGLIVVGWSAEHDVALADCVSDVVSRRYPMYWGARNGHITEAARRIIQRRRAYPIPLAEADEFLCDLRDQVERLNVLAKRRPRFVIHRHPGSYPDWAVAPWSWTVIPALVMRAHASLEPATEDQVGLIGPETRERLVELLTKSPVVGQLEYLASSCTCIDPSTMTVVPRPSLSSVWWPTQGQQSIDFARYRWGGGSDAGVGALFTLSFPAMGKAAGVAVTLDIGISIEAPVPLVTAALLLRECILVVASQVPVAIADLLPPGCEVERVEGTFSASTMTGVPDPQGRTNGLSERIDWTSLGTLPENFSQAGFAVTPGETVGPTVASQIIVEGINHMALSHGFLDPRHGVAILRDALGLGV